MRVVDTDSLRENTEEAAVDADEADEAMDALELALDNSTTEDPPPETCGRAHGHFRDVCEDGFLTTSGTSWTSDKGI